MILIDREHIKENECEEFVKAFANNGIETSVLKDSSKEKYVK
ncbi:hypothetical protein [Acidianus sulfidivorans]|nr:hypothetical protein [Acidianus sulfidivorans]